MEPTRPFRKLLQQFRPKLMSSWTKAVDAKREKMERGIHSCLGLLRPQSLWVIWGPLMEGCSLVFESAKSILAPFWRFRWLCIVRFCWILSKVLLWLAQIHQLILQSLLTCLWTKRPPNASLPHQDVMSPGVKADDCVTWSSLTGHPRWGKKSAT